MGEFFARVLISAGRNLVTFKGTVGGEREGGEGPTRRIYRTCAIATARPLVFTRGSVEFPRAQKLQ